MSPEQILVKFLNSVNYIESFLLCLCSALESVLGVEVMDFSLPSSIRCDKTAPRSYSEASQTNNKDFWGF